MHIFKGEGLQDDNITFYKLGLNGHAKEGLNYIIHVQRILKLLKINFIAWDLSNKLTSFHLELWAWITKGYSNQHEHLQSEREGGKDWRMTNKTKNN